LLTGVAIKHEYVSVPKPHRASDVVIGEVTEIRLAASRTFAESLRARQSQVDILRRAFEPIRNVSAMRG
jgi:hypothetical protein